MAILGGNRIKCVLHAQCLVVVMEWKDVKVTVTGGLASAKDPSLCFTCTFDMSFQERMDWNRDTQEHILATQSIKQHNLATFMQFIK